MFYARVGRARCRRARARARAPYPHFLLTKWQEVSKWTMDCDFSIPLNYQGETPTAGEPFQFQHATCDAGPIYTLIQNTENGAEFYIQKTLSYGDLVLITFFSLFLIFGIVKILWQICWGKN